MATTEADGELSGGEALCLWRFSCAFYAQPGVSEALIALQDRAGLDVNLILFALWQGACGRRRLSHAELIAAERSAGPIRAAIVLPLRALATKAPIRSRCRYPAPPRADQDARNCGGKNYSAPPRAPRRDARQRHRPGSTRRCRTRRCRTGEPSARSWAKNGRRCRDDTDPTGPRGVPARLRSNPLQSAPRRGFERSGGVPAIAASPQRRTRPVSRPNRSRTRPSV
jgi:uncharacterized protein (TIGR02444 family)